MSLYFATKIVSEVKNYGNISSGSPAANVISFEGKGEVFASPDLATINLTIRENAKDVKTAQSKVTVKEASVLEFLDKNGIDKKTSRRRIIVRIQNMITVFLVTVVWIYLADKMLRR